MGSGTAPFGQALGPVWPGWIPSAHRDGADGVLGSCYRDFRNRPYPIRVQITYWGQRLRVSECSCFGGPSGQGVHISGLRATEMLCDLSPMTLTDPYL